jgi:signal transduction histidine kinase
VLPWADRSAALLGRLLVVAPGVPHPPAEVAALARQLAADPPLLAWTVSAAWRDAAHRLDSLPQAAQWLAENAVSVLQWAAGRHEGPLEAAAVEAHADRVAAAIVLAELAAALAPPGDEETPSRARFLGLLAGARGWLLAGDGPPEDHSPALLPASLGDFFRGVEHAETTGYWPGAAGVDRAAPLSVGGVEDPGVPGPQAAPGPGFPAAAECVFRAAAILAGKGVPGDAVAARLDQCRQMAAEGRQNWLAAAGDLSDWLPELAARLARLDELERRFATALEREKLDAMAEFAAGAGHEINNPLTVIAGRAQLFLRQEKDPERRRGLALINAQAMRVYEMIADMRLFARPPDPERRRVDLVELVDRIVDEVSLRAAEQEIEIHRSGETSPLWVELDPAQWGVALSALCHNALESLVQGGHVEVSVRRTAREVEICVSDDGPGIAPEEQRHLFEPFYSARQAGRGLGMGLSKCWRIVTNHGGRIEVRSPPGRGAALAITLPLD